MSTPSEVPDRPERAKGAPKADKVIEQVNKLIALAQSDQEEEARTAAVKAVRLMTEHGLACVPKIEVERAMAYVERARALAATSKEEANKKLFVGLAVGALLGKKMF